MRMDGKVFFFFFILSFFTKMDVFKEQTNYGPCLLTPDVQEFEPNADDILIDEDLLDLFRIIKQVIRKSAAPEDLAKLLFCISYALCDHMKFMKPIHEDRIVFSDDQTSDVYCVKLSANTSCCQESGSFPKWLDSSVASASSPAYDLLLQTPYRPFRPTYTSLSSQYETPTSSHSTLSADVTPYSQQTDTLLEPHQRGFYYQGDRITREPALLQRYAEQGILTQASLLRKRKRHSADSVHDIGSVKKAKIPHRHGEFESRRNKKLLPTCKKLLRLFYLLGDDIINRLRTITFEELEQKADKLQPSFSLAIEPTYIPTSDPFLTDEQRAKLLEPSLRVLTDHSNKKPHLDNGMNQNGIYYNTDYFQLYLAFEQFQHTFSILFPHEIVPITKEDKDRDRNSNMKAYRRWIEPRLIDSNWAAFRRNIVVGERMTQLAKSVGQGILLITKELSGSKLHLTFTNSEWDEFITGLNSRQWDATIDWSKTPDLPYLQLRHQQQQFCSLLITELQEKFATRYWFQPNGSLVSLNDRKRIFQQIQTTAMMFSSLKKENSL